MPSVVVTSMFLARREGCPGIVPPPRSQSQRLGSALSAAVGERHPPARNMMIFCSRPRFIEWRGTYAHLVIDLGFCAVPSEAEQSFEMPDPDLLRQSALTFAIRGLKHADLTQRARHTPDKVTLEAGS